MLSRHRIDVLIASLDAVESCAEEGELLYTAREYREALETAKQLVEWLEASLASLDWESDRAAMMWLEGEDG